MGFRLVPKSVTFNDLERQYCPYFTLFYVILPNLVVSALQGALRKVFEKAITIHIWTIYNYHV